MHTNDSPLDDRDVGVVSFGAGKLLATWFTLDCRIFRERLCEQYTKEEFAIMAEKMDSCTDEVAAANQGSWTMLSSDGGKTWDKPVMNRILFKGIMPALVTPLNDDGTIRENVTRQLLKDLSKTGITGFYILGGTGEGVTIDRNTRIEFAELVSDARPEGMKLINHIGACDLSTVKQLARHSRKIGMDAISSVPPFFFKYDEKGIIDYYKAMSDASDGLPMIIYASPMSGDPLAVSTIEKMMDIPGFIGMKFTNPNYYLLSRYKKIDNGNINIINGPDETCALGLMMGADGAIGSTYNTMPQLFVNIYNAVQSADMLEAMRLQGIANDMIELYLKYNVIEAVKVALEIKGYDVGETNPPMPRMTDAEKAEFRAALMQNGFPGDNW